MSAGPPLITLLTDFGSSDTYVGQVKGAILSVCRTVQLVDLSHDVPPGDIAAASLAWADAVPAFPPGTIHLGVVDPGVGSARRGIAAEIGDWRFVCPDNGLVTRIVQNWPVRRAVELRNPKFWRAEVSPVFHGRDVFGPVAGHWAAGQSVEEFGQPIVDPLVEVPCPVPEIQGSAIVGTILAVDRFGNLRTNIHAGLLASPAEDWTVEAAGHTIRGVSHCFSEANIGEPLALIGSHGHLEIAVNQGNAAQRLQCSPGDEVRVRQPSA